MALHFAVSPCHCAVYGNSSNVSQLA